MVSFQKALAHHTARIGGTATGGLLLLSSVYLFLLRPWHTRWGATDDEVKAALPGDDEVPHPQVNVTRAVSIDAPPEAVWPWLVQIGYHRAGWYAYDLFDNDNVASAETILPALQQLEIGQVLGEEGLAVRTIAPNRHLLLAYHYPKTEWVVKQGIWPRFGHASMCLQLNPLDGGERTRFIYRVRCSAPVLARVFLAFFEPADFVASQKMLLGIKRRAEAVNRPAPVSAATAS
jgi:hypothetical protein